MTTAIEAHQIILPETWLDDDPDYDPYAVFDQQGGAGEESPYPQFRRFRERGGVIRLKRSSAIEEYTAGGGDDGKKLSPGESMLLEWEPGDPEEFSAYGLYTYKTVTDCLRDWKTFSNTGYANLMGLVFGHSILEMDSPEHMQHRSLVAQAFRPKMLQSWETTLVRPVIQEQIDSFKARGEADLTREFTLPYPVKVIAGMLGVPFEHSNWFRRRAIEEISIYMDIERGLEASRVLQEYFKQITALRRQEPGEDLISELVQAEMDGHTLTDEEILPFLMLLSPAGADTTFRSTGNLLYGLLAHPEQLEAVKKDRSLVPVAIEEAIRWEVPLTAVQRWTTREVEVEGVRIPADTKMTMCVGSANRDESVWGEDADQFNIFRPKNKYRHVAFAYGPHTCLGMHLARMEMGIALNMLLDQLPDIHLDPETVDDTFIDGQRFRSPNQLKVRFTPVR